MYKWFLPGQANLSYVALRKGSHGIQRANRSYSPNWGSGLKKEVKPQNIGVHDALPAMPKKWAIWSPGPLNRSYITLTMTCSQLYPQKMWNKAYHVLTPSNATSPRKESLTMLFMQPTTKENAC